MSIEKLIGKDYYPPTKIVGFLTNKTVNFFNIKNSKTIFNIRILINLLFFGFLAFGVLTISGFILNDFLFDSIEIVLAFLWLAIAGLLVDLFEYAVDDFWISYKKISALNEKEFKQIMNDYNNKIFSKKYLIVSVIVYIIMLFVLFEALHDHSLAVIVIVDLLMIPAAIIWGIGIYGTFYMFYFIKKICCLSIDLKPFDPDGFGGLSSIGKLPLRVAALLSSGSLYIPYGINRVFSLSLETSVGFIILILVFVASMIIALTFFIPLLPINRIARNRKNQMLELFGKKLQDRIETKSKKSDSKAYLETLVTFEHYKEIKKMKVWPFSFHMIFEVIGYIFLPTILTLVGWYLQTG